MEKNYIKVGTYVCPYCEKKQTAFVYYYNTEGHTQTRLPNRSPLAEAQPGFRCITPACQKLIVGLDYYRAADFTVGDYKHGNDKTI